MRLKTDRPINLGERESHQERKTVGEPVGTCSRSSVTLVFSVAPPSHREGTLRWILHNRAAPVTAVTECYGKLPKFGCNRGLQIS